MTYRALGLLFTALVGPPLREARGQERSPIPPPLPTDWRITFGSSWGRVHENIVRYMVTDRGQLAYADKRDTLPALGKIPQETVQELTSLVNRLRIFDAREIPSDQFNSCVVSPHLPNVWFSIRRGQRVYSLSHCNTGPAARPRYEYTLDFNAEQKAVYKTLRAKLESLFDAELKSKVGTPQQTTGDARSGSRCTSASRRADAIAKGQRASELPPECRSDHACTLVPPMEIRSVTGRNDVANYAPEAWQSDSSSDCFHQDLVVSVRLMHGGWTAERLEAQRARASRDGYRVQPFVAKGVQGYSVSDAPMVAMTGPYTGETVVLLVGKKLLSISVQTFPEDYLQPSQRSSREHQPRGSVMQLAFAAVAKLPP